MSLEQSVKERKFPQKWEPEFPGNMQSAHGFLISTVSLQRFKRSCDYEIQTNKKRTGQNHVFIERLTLEDNVN